jgi:hypothetical protein
LVANLLGGDWHRFLMVFVLYLLNT